MGCWRCVAGVFLDLLVWFWYSVVLLLVLRFALIWCLLVGLGVLVGVGLLTGRRFLDCC